MKLTVFNELDFLPALKALFKELQVPINAVTDRSISAKEILTSTYRDTEAFRLMDDVYFLGMVDDGAFRGKGAIDLAAAQGLKKDYEGIVIFGVTLKGRDDGKLPTRSQLAEISRAFNREFCYTPVVVVFKYGSGAREYLAFANTERSQYKQKWREGEKAGKVTLLRDIDIQQPHSGHERILADLRIPMVGKDRVDSFAKLYAYWRKVLDVSLLNKEFYKEVSNWYFDACKQVIFPKDAKGNQESLIRLITRLMFVWFLKEKGLVPADLFRESEVRQILRSLEPQESSYYKAILQNLFFATLNTEWGERRFRKKVNQGRDRGYMIHNEFRYGDYFVNAENALQTYFEQIPFLNGGLFECLDRRDKQDEPEVRIDGFSDRADNLLSIPNELFFSEEREVDLNADFGTSRKKYRVRGLIDIFNGYKFTVTENTPLEEEVALDPELLGQVFENLLAAYNPETQTTARKQTGSFYTPREIVNYMVDESLIAYLKNQLLVIGKEDELEQKLRDLFAFDEVNPFADDEPVQERLIAALDGCKILDPACGSGAFPMGVLQKMVFVLRKLDPQNKRWKKQQREKAIAPLLLDIQTAEKISYEAARERAIAELREELQKIEDSFKNEMDYPRKLFLIQNCIFGVDIQPIAVQIAKLRFFISLIIEQKEDHDAENRGILPLPNLETKFVAANTLIGIEKSQQLSIFDTQEIQAKQGRLERLRREHFFARTLATKRKKRDEDELLCREIGEILKRNKFSNVELLQNWKPYDQNASASFFDPEWMFGVNDGFDICIGNPPYIGHKGGIKDIFRKLKTSSLGQRFNNERMDIFYYFFHASIDFLAPKGVTVFITTNYFLTADSAVKLRKDFKNRVKLFKLVNFNELKVFESALGQHNIITFITKDRSQESCQIININRHESVSSETINQILSYMDEKTDYYIKNNSELYDNEILCYIRLEQSQNTDQLKAASILDKIKSNNFLLGNICKISQGIVTGVDKVSPKHILKHPEYDLMRGRGVFVISEEEKTLIGDSALFKPWFKNSDIDRYHVQDTPEKWLIHTSVNINLDNFENIFNHIVKYKKLILDRNFESGELTKAKQLKKWWALSSSRWDFNFDAPKIISPQRSYINEFAYTDKPWYASADVYFISQKDISISLKFILGILNSKIIYFWLYKRGKRKGEMLELYLTPLSQIPIPTAGEGDRVAIEKLVQKCLDAKGQNVKQWEQEIDAIVARLYGLSEDEVKIIKGEMV
jgi:adenine-specific DNA-methyltransferase